MIHIPDNILPKNEQGNVICPKCKRETHACICPGYSPPKQKIESFKPTIKLDKNGRKGKLVTIITDLPPKEDFLKILAKRLKSQTGSGGTFYIDGAMGVIEIQGDHVEKIISLI